LSFISTQKQQNDRYSLIRALTFSGNYPLVILHNQKRLHLKAAVSEGIFAQHSRTIANAI